MDKTFINSEAFDLIAITAILVFGIVFFVGLKLYHVHKGKKIIESFKNSAIRNLNEARQPQLDPVIVFQKISYVAMSLISLDNLGDPKWRLTDYGTNEKEILDLVGIGFDDMKRLADQGVSGAIDIICIIERCREGPVTPT